MFKVIDIDGFKDLRYYGPSIDDGEIIYFLSGLIRSRPTRTSIQISPYQHIEDEQGQYINHNCHPSTKVVGNKLVAVRKINNGDSITFNYNHSEYDMSCPFICNCCGNKISGTINNNNK